MATKGSIITRVRNMFFPGIAGSGPPNATNQVIYSGIEKDPKELNKYRGPVQLLRIKVDTSIWRSSIQEAERPLPSLPYRVIMQQIYIDTVLNGHVAACMQKRKDIILLKDFHICDDNDVTNEAATELLNTDWFQLMRNYIHDAQYYGYSLITFGDMVDGSFPNVQITRRSDVSPDRLNLASFMYIPTGINFMEGEYFDWSLYVPTPSENGVSKCGYGLLYKVALYEIGLRSIIGWNMDYIERFGQPTTVIKVQADNEEERDRAEQAAIKLGSSGSLIIDKNDEFELVSDSDSGSGWQSYDNLESRFKKTISFLLLGHEDAASSQPGKLGGAQGSKQGMDQDDSPIGRALAACESKDRKFEENVVNNMLIPKLIKLGIKIPVGLKYRLKNDNEREHEDRKETEKAQGWANVAVAMSQAGIKMDAKDFTEKTGINATDAPEPVMSTPFSAKLKAKLNKTYGKHKH